MTLAPERLLVEPPTPRGVACVKTPVIRHPENMLYEHLEPLVCRLRYRGWLGTEATALAELLTEHMRWSI